MEPETDITDLRGWMGRTDREPGEKRPGKYDGLVVFGILVLTYATFGVLTGVLCGW